MNKNVPDGKYYGVQVLRALAALAVVAVHSTDYLQLKNGSVPQALRWIHGQAGVDIFFVISGFVMTISSERLLAKAHPTRIFLWRRILRIIPLYWLLTTVKLVAISARPSLSIHAYPSAWNIVSSYLFVPSLNPVGDVRPLIPLGWTLNFEMMFYVLFAIGMWVASRRRQGLKMVVGFLVPAICLLAAVGLLRSGRWPVWTSWADPIVLEFLMGVGVARLAMRARLPGWGVAIALQVLGCAGVILFVPNMVLRPVMWGVPAAAIVLGTVALERYWRHRLPKWLLLLGNASYSIYLIQEFVFPVLHAGVERLGGTRIHTRPLETGIVMMIVSMIVTAAVGVAVYLWVERRMTEFFKSKFGAERLSPVIDETGRGIAKTGSEGVGAALRRGGGACVRRHLILARSAASTWRLWGVELSRSSAAGCAAGAA